MAAPIILASRFSIRPGTDWTKIAHLKDRQNVRHWSAENEIVQLCAYDDVASAVAELSAEVGELAEYLTRDVKREILTFVAAPKPVEDALPKTPYLQLRHIEVPPSRMAAYLSWRADTIFKVVKESAAIECFLAYHSIVSSEPGVMFLSGFSGEESAYNAVFSSKEYQQIVKEAGDHFICDGAVGLYTKIYRCH